MSEGPDMTAFAQVLWPWPLIAIIRLGNKAKIYGDKFYFAVVIRQKINLQLFWPFGKKRPVAIVMALVATPPRCAECEWHKRFRIMYSRVIIDLIPAMGFEEDWERFP